MFGSGEKAQRPSNGDVAPPRQELPPLRTWLVRRVNPIKPTEIEVITVVAHGIEYGPVLAFQVGVRYQNQVAIIAQRGFNAWIDYEEVTPAEPSRILQ